MEFLSPQYKEFILLLNKHQVDYFLLGGYAVNLYGYHRATQDIDFMIRPTNENGKKLLEAITEFGYDTSGYENQNFTEQLLLRLGEAPNSIDVINATLGVNFEEAFIRSKVIIVGDINIRVIHIQDLIANKKALNTFKDLADAEELKDILSRDS